MKKYILAVVIVVATIIAFAANIKVWIYQKDFTRTGFDYDMVDSISRVKPGDIALNIKGGMKNLRCEGGSFSVELLASMPWTAIVNDSNKVKLSIHSGEACRQQKIDINVLANKTDIDYRDTVCFRLVDGTATYLIINIPKWNDRFTVESDDFIDDYSYYVLKLHLDSLSIPEWTDVRLYAWNYWNHTPLGEWPGTLCKFKDGWYSCQVPEKYLREDDDYVHIIWNGLIDTVRVQTEDIEKITKTTCFTLVKKDSVISAIKSNPKTLKSGHNGASFTINVASNLAWTATCLSNWVKLSTDKGSTDETIKVTISPNDGLENDTAIVSFRAENDHFFTCKICREAEFININKFSYTSSGKGDSIDVKVSSNAKWEVISDVDWLSVSQSTGEGDTTIKVSVRPNEEGEKKTLYGKLTFSTKVGKNAVLQVMRYGYSGAGDSITDCQGNIYPTIWIGGKHWMAENLQSTKYDTGSEAYNLNFFEIGTSNTSMYAPYYTNGKYASSTYSEKLTEEQRNHLGLLYNWAAAMGYKTESEARVQQGKYSGTRQGICPNGWHIPSAAEWSTLEKTVADIYDKGSKNKVGTHIKTASGWYNGGNGDNASNFSALPAGYASGSSVNDVGTYAYHWSSDADGGGSSYHCYLYYDDSYLYEKSDYKSYARSVRCIEDDEFVTPKFIKSSANGGSFQLKVKSDAHWSVECDKKWCSVTPIEGDGDSIINVTVEGNETVDIETAVITFTSDSGNKFYAYVNRDAEYLNIAEPHQIYDYKGGVHKLTITSNVKWSVSSDQDWATVNQSSGEGDGVIDIDVKANDSYIPDSATIIIQTTGLSKQSLTVNVVRYGIFKDCQNNDYPTIKIGSQIWMAENLACTKFDTQSEAYKNGQYNLSTTKSTSYAPYYTDGKFASSTYSEKLTEEQRNHLGLLYNWAAAMGYKTESEAIVQQGKYSGTRQGICPNGWHIPSAAEWSTLEKTVADIYDKGSKNKVGTHIKTASGWYNGGNGDNASNFSALPAGYASGSSVNDVGTYAYYWSSDADGGGSSYHCYLYYYDSYLYEKSYYKSYAQSVRCVMNSEEYSPTEAITLCKSKNTNNVLTVRLSAESVRDSTSWENVYLYAWQTYNPDILGEWPGMLLTSNDDDWYSYSFSSDINLVNIIWNGGDDAHQTKDIENVGDSQCYQMESDTSYGLINCNKYCYENIQVEAEGGSVIIKVDSNTSWTASANSNWVKLSTENGLGNGEIEVSVEENFTEIEDSAIITFTTSKGKTTTSTIHRAGKVHE